MQARTGERFAMTMIFDSDNDRALLTMTAFMVDGTEEGFINLWMRCKQE